MKKIYYLALFISLYTKGQVINIAAGNGNTTHSFSGDNGLAIHAGIAAPQAIICDRFGNLYFSDVWNHRIRKVDTSGVITTFAGTGAAGNTGNGGPAINARVNTPTDLKFDRAGNLYFSDDCLSSSRSYIRKIDPLGIITNVGGDTTSSALWVDGSLATQIAMTGISSLAFDPYDNLYYADGSQNVIKKIDSSGIVNTVIGSGNNYYCPPGSPGPGFNGDDSSALVASFSTLAGIAIDKKGNFFICDRQSAVIRKVDAITGIITTFAGVPCSQGGTYGAANGPAAFASFNSQMHDIKIDTLNNLYICDWNHVYKIDTMGVLTRIAGVSPAFAIAANDSGPALAWNGMTDRLAIDNYNHIYVSDATSNLVTKITTCASSLPLITINAISGVNTCNGDTLKLVATGAQKFIWQPWAASITDSLIFVPTSSVQYTAMGYSDNGCVGIDTFNVNIINNCIWPGDANEDLIVDNNDLFPLGLKFGKTGPTRTTIDNSWKGFTCSNWTDTLNNGKNAKYIDCNGDGIIGFDDTLAINLNYGFTHLARVPQQTVQSTNTEIFFSYDRILYYPGDTVHASLHIGRSLAPQTNFYGANFTVLYDKTKVRSGSEQFSFSNSWVGILHQTEVTLHKTFSSQGKLEGALVRTTLTDTSGFGAIGILSFILKDTLTSNIFTLNINNSNKIDQYGINSSLITGTDSVALVQGVGVPTFSHDKNQLLIFPNPANTWLKILSTYPLNQVIFYNSLGQEVLQSQSRNTSEEINISGIPSGVYTVKINHLYLKFIKE